MNKWKLKNKIRTNVKPLHKDNQNKQKGVTLIALIITMVLHYYYCIKYSNFNGFLESNV